MALVERFLGWLDRNYRRLLVLGLFANAAAIFSQLVFHAFKWRTFEDVAREEIRRWLATHNITVIVQQVQERTVEMSESTFILIMATLLFLALTMVITRC